MIRRQKHLIFFGPKLEVPAIVVAVYRQLLDWWDVGIDLILDGPSTLKKGFWGTGWGSLGCGFKCLVFWRNNGWMMENMEFN